MKKFIEISCISGLILTIIASAAKNVYSFEQTRKELADGVVRLHIIADSDSAEAQRVKLLVRDAVLSESSEFFCGSGTKSDLLSSISENLAEIELTAEKVLRENGCQYEADCEITEMYFPTRVYEDFTMPPGYYDALRITLGSAEGKNWWCVMYPPLCIPSASELSGLTTEDGFTEEELELLTNPQKYEVRFKCVELAEKLRIYFEKASEEAAV